MGLHKGKEQGVGFQQPVVGTEDHQLLTRYLDPLSLSQNATTRSFHLYLFPI